MSTNMTKQRRNFTSVPTGGKKIPLMMANYMCDTRKKRRRRRQPQLLKRYDYDNAEIKLISLQVQSSKAHQR